MTAPALTKIEASNSLADLAARIKAEHEAVSDSVRHAIAAGELLVETKHAHGQWLLWLRDHCTIAERTAQLYMRCAKNRSVIEDQIRNGVADLSLNEAAATPCLNKIIGEEDKALESEIAAARPRRRRNLQRSLRISTRRASPQIKSDERRHRS
jgi:hypothetical protein